MESSKIKILKKPKIVTLKEMKPGERLNVVVKVISVKMLPDLKRYDNTVQKHALCVVGDSSGVVNMLARNDQIEIVKEGSVIILRNAHARVIRIPTPNPPHPDNRFDKRFEGNIRLEVDIWGKIEEFQENLGEINITNDYSQVIYEILRDNKK